VAPDPVTVPAGVDPAMLEATRSIAGSLLEAGFRALPLEDAVAARRPVLLVGATDEVEAALARAGLPARPAQLSGRGTARVWAARHAEVPFLVVEADSAPALSSIAGVVRHYGASSYVVFDGRAAIDRGVWPPSARPLEVTFTN
jgi:aminopeptidase N